MNKYIIILQISRYNIYVDFKIKEKTNRYIELKKIFLFMYMVYLYVLNSIINYTLRRKLQTLHIYIYEYNY